MAKKLLTVAGMSRSRGLSNREILAELEKLGISTAAELVNYVRDYQEYCLNQGAGRGSLRHSSATDRPGRESDGSDGADISFL